MIKVKVVDKKVIIATSYFYSNKNETKNRRLLIDSWKVIQ